MEQHPSWKELPPDIETASESYAKRFAGPIGEFLLHKQSTLVKQAISSFPMEIHNILEVGGGHCQTTQLLLASGRDVTLHGSHEDCFARSRAQQFAVSELCSPLFNIAAANNSFDLSIALRLIPHIEDWREFLLEILRVSKYGVIFDYAELLSWNILTPALFQIKKRIEGNTRPYFCHRTKEFIDFANSEKLSITIFRQFALPMGIHRKINNVNFSENSENFCSKIGVTNLIGSPVIVALRKIDSIY
jgi:hypothetical protein